MTILKNEGLTVQVSEHGAELQSIRKGDVEYLWQGDPTYWGRRSPVLFPIVGSVWESRYRVGEKEFSLGQHGFARDMDFTLVSSSDTEVRYRLDSSEQTKDKYPYDFTLEIAYRLHGINMEDGQGLEDNSQNGRSQEGNSPYGRSQEGNSPYGHRLDVIWEVSNPSQEDIFFQIGAHPAFFYPDYDPEKSGRGSFTFDRSEGLECIRIVGKGCVDVQKKWPLDLADGVLKLEKDTFDAIDTIMLEGSQVRRVNMFREDGTPWLALSFDAPVVGIWSPPGKNAPFICIEPWYGRCDRFGYEGDYRDKDWVNRLSPGEKFASVYTIEIA